MIRLSTLNGLFRQFAFTFLAIATLGACTPAPSTTEIVDPFETFNRKTHAFNKKLDQALLRPASTVYGAILPDFAIDGVDNFASNLALPGMVVNDILQLNLPDATSNTIRFLFNTTVGIGGLIDVAGHNNIYEQSTNFGETLYVWGFPEGNYVELPAFAASTERDTLGLVVDFAMDPVSVLIPAPHKYLGTAAKVLGRFGDRHKYSELVDSVLYDSEDSYAQARLLYLQSRRRELQGGLNEDDLEDPYAE